MKILLAITMLVFATGCDFDPEVAVSAEIQSESESERENEVQRGSFRVRNAEIRQEIIAALVKQNIQHWVNDDGSIGYLLSDGVLIDKIGYDAIGRYAARN